jgi:hypothetical protein
MASTPFSARNRGAHRQIDNAFPPSARNGLMHILFGLVEQNYLEWAAISRELQRISRLPPVEYDNSSVASIKQAGKSIGVLKLFVAHPGIHVGPLSQSDIV